MDMNKWIWIVVCVKNFLIWKKTHLTVWCHEIKKIYINFNLEITYVSNVKAEVLSTNKTQSTTFPFQIALSSFLWQ